MAIISEGGESIFQASDELTSASHGHHSVQLETPNFFSRLRRSDQLVVAINFMSMVTGIMAVSVLQPILPDLLDAIYRRDYTLHASPRLTFAWRTPRPSTTWSPISTPLTTEQPSINATFPNKSLIIGSLIGFAPLIEIFFTPVAVVVVKYFGFKKPMICACLIWFVGCYTIAYAKTLWLLYVSRIFQAVSVIFTTVAGFALVAIRFDEDDARSRALATSMLGFPIGILVAYPVGTAIYHYYGVAVPFIIISFFAILGLMLILVLEEMNVDKKCMDDQNTSFVMILSNRSVLLSLNTIMFSWFLMFLLGATTPNRMASELRANTWQIGLVLFVSTLVQIVTSTVVGKLAGRVNRWLVALIGNLIACLGLACYPFCASIYHAFGPETAVRTGWGLVTSSMGPLLGALVDQSQGSAFLRVYALFMSFNLFGAFAGSLFGGWLDGIVGFDLLFWSTSVVALVISVAVYVLSCCLKLEDEDVFDVTLPFVRPEYQPESPSTSSTYGAVASSPYCAVTSSTYSAVTSSTTSTVTSLSRARSRSLSYQTSVA